MKKAIIFCIIVTAIFGCRNSDTTTINGQFYGAAGKRIDLEELSPTGSKIVDTVVANSDGKFSFTIDFTKKIHPTFFNVRLDNQFAPLLLDGGEKVELDAIGNIFVNYNVRGSKNSELLKGFNNQTTTISLKLDSLHRLANSATTEQRVAELGREYSREYIKMKQAAIQFVVRNAGSLAAIVPLYQPIFNGMMLFDEPTDIVYYKAVADSLEKYYPNSPYVTSLKNDIKRVGDIEDMDAMLRSAVDNRSDFPDIVAKTKEDKEFKMSSLVGKPILLIFTSISEPTLKILNREVLDYYTKYHDSKGLEVVEVSVDTDKAAWIRSVIESRLPWVQINDLLGVNSPSVALYNVKKVPAYFFISADGDVVAANQSHDQIGKLLEKELK